jgi:hypothetical protein
VEGTTVVHRANVSISSTQQLASASIVQYIAGSEIDLDPGFDCEGEFTVLIEGCNINSSFGNNNNSSTEKAATPKNSIPAITQDSIDIDTKGQ